MPQHQTKIDIKAALELGEGQFIEFKETPDKSLAREIVAFANASGGTIYIGITDSGIIKGIETSNSSKIRCIHFSDDKRIDILDKKEVDRGIIGNIEYAITYLKELVPVRFEIKDLKRDEFPEYPIEAYREAIVNAVIHFDYFLGDTIAIEKLKSSIVINNKGELLFPKNEFGKKSEARNRLLVDLLARTDFMEKAGTGIKRVTNACNKNNNKVNFQFSDSFWLTIETNNSENVTENVTEKRHGLILKLLKINDKITVDEIAEKLNVTKRTIIRDIEKMKTNELIKRIGPAKGGHWEIIK